MGDQLMAMQVEIDPVARTPPFRAAEQLSVEAARRGKVVNRDGEMEGRNVHDPCRLNESRACRN
jgi:hypothetical protein